MRGALYRIPDGFLLVGIIPADAGSTDTRICVSAPRRDHPRGCGEHDFSICLHVTLAGSSPRMRGALVDHLQGPAVVRIIPADAGSTAP